MDSIDDILLDSDDKMTKSLAFLDEQLSGLRTGKASPALVENLQVPYYGTPTRLKELAGISTPEPRLIVISPYDPTALSDIGKTILAANIGVTPMNDGRVIRVPIPELDRERRADLTKVARRMAEEARVAVRNVRREANDAVKALEKKGDIGEDDRDRTLDTIQQQTNDAIATVDETLKHKEGEIMEV